MKLVDSTNLPAKNVQSNPSIGCAVSHLEFGYGNQAVVRDASFSIEAGHFFTLLGPSGCGKTTLLKLIGGYLSASNGHIEISNRCVTQERPERRNAGMVFQNYALFPHLSAQCNVSFGLEVRKLPRAQCLARADAMLERVGLTPSERIRKPAQLSGGQQQRVALARALVIQPDILLLDEPLANLDRHLREQLRIELRILQREMNVTTILVTHDQEEALMLSDQIGVMNAGRLVQVGEPGEVYSRPRNAFVARFLGDANILDGQIFGREGKILVRPEQCQVGESAERCRWHWSADVIAVSFLGADVVLEVQCRSGPRLRVRSRSTPAFAAPTAVKVGIPDESCWVIPEAAE